MKHLELGGSAVSNIDRKPHESTTRTIWQALENSVEQWGSREAITFHGARVTYAEMLQHVDRLATGLLAAGIQPDDHVSIIFPLCPEWIYTHYALTTIGAIVVPININYKADEVRWVLKQGDVNAVIAADSFLNLDFLELLKSTDPALESGEVHSEQFPLIKRMFVFESGGDRGGPYTMRSLLSHEPSSDERARLAEIRAKQTADDPAYILFTSGSTARPKPAIVPHRAICGVGYYQAKGCGMGEGDRFLAMLTTFHIGGVVPCIASPHSVGATTCLVPAFEPRTVLETIERERCTASIGFDTMFTKLAGHPDFGRRDISSLKKATVACTPSAYDQLQKWYHFDCLGMTYGCTEGSSGMSLVMPGETDPEIRRNSNGRPHPGIEVRIVDTETGQVLPPNTPGEICFRGWNRFLGYYNMPEETAAAIDAEGFVHMGDYGWLNEQGYLYYRGRYKMMVKTGGENVSQREVEIFLEDNIPGAEFAQVVGVPDEVWGEAVVAFIQLRAGSTLTPEEIREHCRGKIAGFKIPKHVFILESKDWPILAVGRPDKHTLRKMALQRLGREELA
ncbi:MAG: hypothetical protein EPO21_02960 [Chloroflexota bacterium]|nr:MAG: hypothetical protein EPO21_02960 [Chloroflexota bacterium]